MDQALYDRAYRWCTKRLRLYLADYMDCGEPQRTQLGEDCADAIDAIDSEGHIPNEVWDAAHDACNPYDDDGEE